MQQTEKKTSFKTNYYIETEMQDIIKKEIIFLVVAAVGLILSFIIIGSADEGDSTTFWKVCIVVLIALGAWTIWNIMRIGKIAGNVSRCYYEIKDTYVCGYSFTNIEEADNGAYFEVAYEDIRGIRYATSSVVAKSYYTLFIDYKGGTYKLCIDDGAKAAKATEQKMAEMQAREL